ncbi:hypothetical protein GCM10023172_00310 [Hymenobacter ginsengisoli]|uniref:Uncharacterized protein n=1 Tax=Hymenobacter ginsengisoli TaxID=1051626 RepID=A0ABP8PVN5_9BACT
MEQKTPLRNSVLLVPDWPLAATSPLSFFYGMEELLHPRHPLDKYHQLQLDFLAALPEALRAERAPAVSVRQRQLPLPAAG